MRRPDALAPLIDHGIIDEVLRPLMSGKEAQVYLVVAEGEERVAKVYKEAQNRTFKHRAAYTEGRAVRNTRDRRAMAKRSRHGKELDEEGWRAAEVDIIYRLQAAGVRVPEPYNYVDGVLVMELVKDEAGRPAPRLSDLHIGPEQGRAIFKQLLGEVVKMLCAGIVHGDLSEFNVLLSPEGPVVIDFPQAVEAARNQSARRLLIRDIDNLGRYLCRPRRGRPPRYGQEMWATYERGELTPETTLTGLVVESNKATDTEGVLAEIEDVAREAERRSEGSTSSRRRRRRGGGGPRPVGAETTTPSGPKGPEVIVVKRGQRNAIPALPPPAPKAPPPPARPAPPTPARHDRGNGAPAPAGPPRRRRRRRRPGPNAPPKD